jgi:hypothetical protein
MNAKAKEKLRWFQILTSLYEIATPHIEACTGLQCRAIEERSIDCEAVNQNAHILRQLLLVIKNMPAPRTEELITCTKKYFETALSSCINASEALVKYVQVDTRLRESQIHLDNLINSIVLAREYSESTHKRLNAYRE